jgi:hypothetical protein
VANNRKRSKEDVGLQGRYLREAGYVRTRATSPKHQAYAGSLMRMGSNKRCALIKRTLPSDRIDETESRGCRGPYTPTSTLPRTHVGATSRCGRVPTDTGQIALSLPENLRGAASQGMFPLSGWMVRASSAALRGRRVVVVSARENRAQGEGL